MKKPFLWHELSDQACAVKGCRRMLKKNVVERVRHKRPLVCYGHWLLSRNSFKHRHDPTRGQEGKVWNEQA